jgi:DNA-binding transcriptional MocR family regulator
MFVSRLHTRPAADTDWQQVALGASPVESAGLDVMRHMANAPVLQLARGYPDPSVRPDGRIAAAMARASRRPEAWSAPPQEGLPELRAWFATEIGVAPDEAIISPGAQGAISATMRALLPSGSPVLFSLPTYPGAMAVARSAGLIPIPVPCDEHGVRPELLERAFATTGSRLLYLQPTFVNPSGLVLASERRTPVLEIAAAAGAFVLEDDWARWLGHGPPPPPPLIRDDMNGHVITVTSLTKVAAPSLRIGAILARGPVLHRIAAMRHVDDFFVSRPLQEAAVELVTSAGWQAHLRAFASVLRQRSEALSKSVTKLLPDCSFMPPAGGMSLWVALPRGVDESVVVDRALALGVAVNPGRLFGIGESDIPHLRLSFAAIDTGAIEVAVRRLTGAIESVR